MWWISPVAVLALGSIVLGGSAAALTIARLEANADFRAREGAEIRTPAGYLQLVQMPMWPFDPRRANAMPPDQRDLLNRLLSPELSEVVSPAERQILSQALDRGDRLSAQAVNELSAMLRDKQSRQAERLATAKAEAERQKEQAAAEAERQRQREQAAAEAESRRQREQAAAEAEAERQRKGQAQTAAEAERRRQTEQAAAAAERQRQAELAAADAERQRQAAAAAEAERQRQAQLAAVATERQRQAAEAAQALAEAKQAAEAAAANAARLVFYDEFPPLQPL